MHIHSILVVTVAGIACATPLLQSRDVINHDKVVGFKEAVTPGIGDMYLKYKPWLYVPPGTGCKPYPAVDEAGNVSGGLAPSGEQDGKCKSSPGQVYCRAGDYDGKFAIMYSWYFPKDSNAHRHDWENIVVWLSDRSTSASVLGISYSQHRGYHKKTSKIPFDGSHPMVDYLQGESHFLEYSTYNKKGEMQPLINYAQISQPAQNTLASHNFGSANVPFIDKNYVKNLEKAKL